MVGEVKKVGKSRNFHPKVGKSRNFSVFKVGKIALCGLRWFKLNMSKRWGNSVQGVWGTGGIGHGAYWQWGHRGYGAHG